MRVKALVLATTRTNSKVWYFLVLVMEYWTKESESNLHWYCDWYFASLQQAESKVCDLSLTNLLLTFPHFFKTYLADSWLGSASKEIDFLPELLPEIAFIFLSLFDSSLKILRQSVYDVFRLVQTATHGYRFNIQPEGLKTDFASTCEAKF